MPASVYSAGAWKRIRASVRLLEQAGYTLEAVDAISDYYFVRTSAPQ